MTNEEKKEYDKNYYLKNKEKILNHQKEYNQANKEKRNEYEKQWRKNNDRLLKEQKKQWYIDNKEKRKEYLEINKDKFKERRSRYYRTAKFKNYGISEEQYIEMFNKQNGCCCICKMPQEKLKTALHIDHNHTTGKIRGLLCFKCNIAIGYFNNNINLLSNAIDYLKIND